LETVDTETSAWAATSYRVERELPLREPSAAGMRITLSVLLTAQLR
jgi:hypothetical protein